MELRISEAAALSIVEQADYYEQAADLSLVLKWETAVDAAIKSLLTLPERGAPCRFRSPVLADLRWIFVPDFPKHMIFYRYLHREAAVLIVQVQYGARDLESLLSPDA